MPMSVESIITAQVILRAENGRVFDGSAMITSDNVADFAPAPGNVARVGAAFRANGFEIGSFVGMSFSITGTLRAFEAFFGLGIRLGEDLAYEFVAGNKTIGHELSNAALPGALQEDVLAVVFPLPPDFGPTGIHLQ